MSRRGRPALPPETRTNVDIRLKLSPVLYDRLCRLALKADRPVTVIVRKILERDARRAETLTLSP